MAEVIIKSNMKEGDTIAISFNKKKEVVVMKVLHVEEVANAIVDDSEEAE
jgi:hypothetical protein